MPAPRSELGDAFEHYVTVASDAIVEGDRDPWADLFTEDAVYVERNQGRFEGRDAIRTWMHGLDGFPQSEMVAFPVTWSVLDEDAGTATFACFNELSDPGDGSRHRALVWARLRYAGDGRWHGEENIYNALDFATMMDGWQRARDGEPPDAAPGTVAERTPAEADVPSRPASAEELAAEFARYYDVVARCRAAGDWSGFGELFTEDAVYVDHTIGIVHGREAIVDWTEQTMAVEHADELERFDVLWTIIDDRRGWVISATANRMSDPGDGSVHEAHDWSRTVYAGDGRWSYKENMYNPLEFATMFSAWAAASASSTTSSAAR